MNKNMANGVESLRKTAITLPQNTRISHLRLNKRRRGFSWRTPTRWLTHAAANAPPATPDADGRKACLVDALVITNDFVVVGCHRMASRIGILVWSFVLEVNFVFVSGSASGSPYGATDTPLKPADITFNSFSRDVSACVGFASNFSHKAIN